MIYNTKIKNAKVDLKVFKYDPSNTVFGKSYQEFVEKFNRWHDIYGKGAYVVEDGSGFCPLIYEYLKPEELPVNQIHRFTNAMKSEIVVKIINCCLLSEYGVIVLNPLNRNENLLIYLMELKSGLPEFTGFTGKIINIDNLFT